MAIILEKKSYNEEEVTSVMVKCDHCGKDITDAKSSIYLWQANREAKIVTDHYHLHKGVCEWKFKANKLPDPNNAWRFGEMTDFVKFLAANLGM